MQQLKEILKKIRLENSLDESSIYLEEHNKEVHYSYNHSIAMIKSSNCFSLISYDNLQALAHSIILYYKDKFEDLDSNSDLFFNLKFKNLSGNKKSSKFSHLMNHDYVVKKLKKLKEIYTEVFYLSKSKESYATKHLTSYTNKKVLRENEFLENTYLKNSNGDVFSLKELSRTGEDRASELYAFNKQLEEKSIDMKKTWIFATITCPGIFHINAQKSRNSWNGNTTPKDSVDFINKIWRNFIKEANRQNLNIFGNWSKEPHKSSAVHLHALIYCDFSDVERVNELLKRYTRQAFEDVNCRYYDNKDIQSCKCVVEDSADNLKKVGKKKASPASYIFKYIMKSLLLESFTFVNKNGKEQKVRLDNEDFEAIRAHYKLYKYRRFGFFGIDRCIVLWRELKRFSKLELTTENETLKKLVKMVDDNNFKDFSNSELKLEVNFVYKHNVYDEDGNFAFIYNDGFGDPKKQIVGIEINGVEYKTHNDYELFVKSK
jgi:hypothetical protein